MRRREQTKGSYKQADSLTSYLGLKYKIFTKIFTNNLLHINKSQAMWIDTGTKNYKGKTTHPAMWIDIGGRFPQILILTLNTKISYTHIE